MSDIRKFFDLCYVDGSPDGVVRCQFADTQYVAYRFPRERFEDLRKMKNKDNILEHLECKGVYFLLTYSDAGKLAQVYVGKAGERADDRLGLLNRIYEHRNDKYKNWTEAVLLTTKGNDWSATELNYLENGFFQLVQERLGKEVCINAATPTASQPTYQQQHALDGLMQVYAPECFRVMGISLLVPHEKKKRHFSKKNQKRLVTQEKDSPFQNETIGQSDNCNSNGAKSPAAPFQFAMLADAGIKIGTELEFIYGGQKVKVADLKNKIEFKGEEYTTTKFCKKFMPSEKRNSKDAYQGPKFFTYKGESLVALRAKLGK